MRRSLVILSFLIALVSCKSHTGSYSASYSKNTFLGDSVIAPDPIAQKLINPYKVKLDSLMDVKVIEADADLTKDNPEGSLGNMVCDVLMEYARNKSYKPDLCLMNNGGLRVPAIYKGPVYVRTLFELMPFENQLVILRIKGSKCKELIDMIARFGGAPVSGLRMEIAGDKAINVTINGKPLDENREYLILTSDYLAGGGDKSDALKDPLELIDLNVKIRDVLIEQLKDMYYNGVRLQAIKDGRIIKN